MNGERCTREDELLDALERGFVGPELEAHTTSCPSCHELHLVAGALLDDRVHAMREAPVPSSGTMWWRMRVRARQEAIARARRSLLIGQAVTVLIAFAMVIAFFGHDLRHFVGTIRLSTPLFLLVTWILAAPIAGWVTIRQK